MFKLITRSNIENVVASVLLTGAIFISGPVVAEEELIASDEFRISCVSCHGVGGKGNGHMAQFLTIKPTDLTALAKNNNGQYPGLVPGIYPFMRVFQIVDGRTQVSGHGERAMPVWGNRYMIQDAGPPGVQEVAVRARILELVYYIQSIQQK